MLTVASISIILGLLTSFVTCQGQQVATELVEAGNEFNRTCTIRVDTGLNITCTYPDGSISSSDTTTQTHNLRKLSNLKNRLTLNYQSDGELITATLTIRNASHLDTGYYGCRPNNSDDKLNETYIFVHPSNINHGETEDLLFPTLDVYVFEKGKVQQFLLPFRPTHPDVEIYLSRSSKDHWIEVFSSEYKAIENEIWTWNKHRGLSISEAKINQMNGVYWLDAKLNGRTTTRKFSIFVADNTDDKGDRPRIHNAVEYRIFPSGSSFTLKCKIRIDVSRHLNITWKVPEPLKNQISSLVTYDTEGDYRSATINVSDIRFRYTGNYTCHRSDDHSLFANQYVFVSDAENLLLPIDTSFVFDVTQRAVLPCRPTHPDVEVSLQKEGMTGRGKENITLYPLTGSKQSDWTFNMFQGFQTKKNASRATAGRKYLCKGTKFKQNNIHFIDIVVADLKLYPVMSDTNADAIVNGDETTLKCDTHNGNSTITWRLALGADKQEIKIDSPPYPAGISNVTRTSSSTELRWENITKSANGFYECRYIDSRRHNVTVQLYHMIVKEAKAPRLISENVEKKKLNYIEKEGKDVILPCQLLEGTPKPNISWFKNNVLLEKLTLGVGLTINETKINETLYSSLHLDHVEPIDEGEYTCHFVNREGSDYQTFQLMLDVDGDLEGTTIAIIVVLILIVILLIVVARIFYVRFSDHKNINPTDISKILEPLLAGNPERINRKLPLDGQSELLPYDNRWEFPRERLKIGKQLGAGCFGRVLKGQAEGIILGEELNTETVAVKMVRTYADLNALASLVSELKILIHLGSHLNIVNLLGACTDVSKGDFLVIVEYCHFDNLLNYLLANRHCYVDQVDENGDLKPLNFQNPSSCGNSDYLPMGSPAFKPVPIESKRKRSRKETAEYIAMLLTNRRSVAFGPQDETHDEDGTDAPQNESFSTRDLICWSFQIARGMDYLSGKNVVHGDLAARNVLLAANGVVKIADFGLSRKVYQGSNYKKKGEGMLPVKWMALESLTDRIFSSQSDVWAFGITIWEIFSLGKTPYPDMEDVGGLIQHLECEGRMEIPRNIPSGVAQIIRRCWKTDPGIRPTFGELENMLGDWVEESVRIKYVEMNETYSRRNAERFVGFVDEGQSSVSTNQQLPSTAVCYVNV